MVSGPSRKKFDHFYRDLLYGSNDAYPKPRTFKLNRTQLFPDRGTVFDYMFEKKGSGDWRPWTDLIEKGSQIPPDAKVSLPFPHQV